MDENAKDATIIHIPVTEYNIITNAIKENTAALVEIGVAVKKLENKIAYLLNKGAVRG